MLEAIRLTKRYESGVVALDNLSLTVAPGEFFCLLGGSGAGKTTAIHLFLGYIRPTDGCVRIGGIEVDDDPLTARRKLAYIPSQMNLHPGLTGLENLGYFTELAGRAGCPRQELMALLRKVGVPDSAIGQPVREYSAAMRQSVGLALACAKRAEVLLLDEPTACLNSEASEEFMEQVKGLAAGGMAVLLTTEKSAHARHASRIGVLHQGHLKTPLVGERTPLPLPSPS